MRDFEDCRTYVEHLEAQHRRLHKNIRGVRSAVVYSGGADRDASAADVTSTLRRMRDEIAKHFHEEECGGCMDEAVSRCPRLFSDVQRVESEHRELLARIRKYRGRMPSDFKFDRLDANERR